MNDEQEPTIPDEEKKHLKLEEEGDEDDETELPEETDDMAEENLFPDAE